MIITRMLNCGGFVLWGALLACNSQEPGDADSLHAEAIVADTHNDVLWGQTMKGRDISGRLSAGHTDLVRLNEGGMDVQVFSVFCNDTYGKGTAFDYANAEIDSLYAIIGRNPDKIALARNAAEVDSILRQKKIAALIGVEGGHMIEDNMDYLDSLYRRGMIYLTLTWNNSTSWATSASDEADPDRELPHTGLSGYGKQVVRRLNELGVMIDVSHVGEQTFYDVIEISDKPVIASHSNAYALAPVPRNLKDEQIRAIAESGGIVCVNFYSGFVDSDYGDKMERLRAKYPQVMDSLKQLYTDGYADRALLDMYPGELDRIRPPLSLLLDHIDHIVQLAGIDYVGIGGDFDGTNSLVQELDDVSCYPALTRALLERGYDEAAVRKILGENFLRVLKAHRP